MNQAQQRLVVYQRRKKVVRLYLEGNSQATIAETVEVDKETISRDLAFIRKEWLSEMVKDFNELKAKELAKIDNLEAEAWEAWRKSAEPVTTTRKRTESVRQHQYKGKGRTKGAHQLVPIRFHEETTIREGGTGDPKFMEVISWCIETRLRIANLLKGDTVNQEVTINWNELCVPAGSHGTSPSESNGRLVLDNDPIEAQIRGIENLSKVQPLTEGVVNGEVGNESVQDPVRGDARGGTDEPAEE